MKVSIIIPVYGVENYLDACIRSVITQTFSDIEIILVDDGGRDACPQMCDDWAEKDKRIRVIHKENGGQGTARNAALDIANGDYVLFVDSDDTIDKTMVEKLVKSGKDGYYDVVLCGYMVNNSVRLAKVKWFEQSFEADNERIMLEYVKGNIFTGPVCKLFKKEIFDGIRFPDFRANEDAFIMHRLFGKCKNAYFLHDHLYMVTLRNDSTEGKDFNPNKIHLIDCAVNLRQYVTQNYPQYLEFVQNNVAQDALVLLGAMYRSNSQKKYTDIETRLQAVLKEERQYLVSENCGCDTVKVIDEYFNHPHIYVAKNTVFKILRGVKKSLKSIILCLKK